MENVVIIETSEGTLKDSEISLEIGDTLSFVNWMETEESE